VTAALSFATMCSVGTTLLPDRCPQRLGVAWSSRWMAATPGLLVIARADDVDGVAVTGIKDRADQSIRKMTCLMLAVCSRPLTAKTGVRVP
jgi:hypothetical protein